MRILFIHYHILSLRHRLSWVLDSNEKVAVQHVLSTVGPTKLQKHLESDLALSHSLIENDFKKGFAHAPKTFPMHFHSWTVVSTRKATMIAPATRKAQKKLR